MLRQVALGMLTLWFAAPAAAVVVDAQMLDGSEVRGELVSWDNASVVIASADGEARMPTAEVMRIVAGEAAAGRAAMEVQLSDGSLVAVREFSFNEGTARLALTVGTAAEVDAKAIRAVRLVPMRAETLAAWEAVVAEGAASDRVVLPAEGAVDHLEGVLGDVSGERVEFTIDGESEPVSVARRKLVGLVYGVQRGSFAKTECRLRDVAGSEYVVSNVALDGATARLRTAAGAEFEVPAESIASVDFSGGRVVFLSDVPIESVEYTPWVGLVGGSLDTDVQEPAVDRTPGGEPLRLDGRSYARGISLATRMRVVYRLPRDAEELRAVVGIDASSEGRGSGRLVIDVDGEVRFDEAIAGGEAAREVTLPVAGGRRLTVLADFGAGGGDVGYVNLCEARITK